MPSFDVPGLNSRQIHTGPYGNSSRDYVQVEPDVAFDASANDLVYVAPLPIGMRVHEVSVSIYDATSVNTTADVGVAQKGDGDFTDDLDAFLDGVAINATGTFHSRENTRHAPVEIEDPEVYLVIKPNADLTDAAAQQFKARVWIDYEYKGTP